MKTENYGTRTRNTGGKLMANLTKQFVRVKIIRGENMTALAMKTETKQMIDEMTDEHVALVFAYAKNFMDREYVARDHASEKMAAFERMKKMRKPMDCDIDYKKEYIDAITERYENIG